MAARTRRDWTAAYEQKVDGRCCRICGNPYVEAAHVIARRHDSKLPIRADSLWRPYDVHPDRIIPLCHDCHQGPNGQHAGRLDLLPALTIDEQVQAVADAGSISIAYRLLSKDGE